MSTKRDAAVQGVLLAWRVEGAAPWYHRKMKAYLKRHWWSLWAMLDELDRADRESV